MSSFIVEVSIDIWHSLNPLVSLEYWVQSVSLPRRVHSLMEGSLLICQSEKLTGCGSVVLQESVDLSSSVIVSRNCVGCVSVLLLFMFSNVSSCAVNSFSVCFVL